MRRLSAVAAQCGLVMGVCACGDVADAPFTPPGPLVDALAWQKADPANDPFAASSGYTLCPLPGFHIEGAPDAAVLEVDTDECDAVTVTQPLLDGVPASFPIEVSIAHLDLVAPRPATATVAIAVGDRIAWLVARRIPSPSTVVTDVFAVDVDTPAGTPIYFHVRNHGANTYYLQGLRAGSSR